MSDIDFAKKISYQRALNKSKEKKDDYGVIREFESDRGRIINSAAIRRLQQKTQVFPLERNAAVRSRLTHSMEVQQIGRYIAKNIIDSLRRQGKLEAYGLDRYEIPFESMVEMACLMHDIGNPPFGHFGESALRNWFSTQMDAEFSKKPIGEDGCEVACLRLQEGSDDLNTLRRKIRQDLSQFEGNAQAVRMVHTLLKLNLTYSQVACILKYTKPAYRVDEPPADYDYLMKKPGFYLSEEAFVRQLRSELGMKEFHRFPLTYIMEAADDISYCIADLEDAVEKKLFSIDRLYQLLEDAWGKIDPGDLFMETVGKAFESREHHRWRSSDDQFFMNLRVNTVGRLVPHASKRFIEHLPNIFHGEFNQALLEDGSPQNRLLKTFKQVAFKHVFNHHEVEQLELQGSRVMRGLLDIYHPLLKMPSADFRTLVQEEFHRKYPIETRLYHKLSRKHCLAYREAVELLENKPAEQQECLEFYYRGRLIQDYISGMTDLYAYDEYRRLMAAD
ncbi:MULTISPECIES: dGTPase [Lonsdalea]|uniref:DGTPase n=2 Tax=Lonsdalea TaxID=1082702 RepID=A0ACD1J9T2_9GAMM|nr:MULTISPECIES: dGTPase [Lonsdalea]RAT11401.1 dGTPase [Lonsdalea quercina]RAT21237.1 dGTPase [Lonsdalea populi]RAT25197.1 dGTPase [Lonsdalea populi]RAT28290.1 dGTPase [Lonsdalea populi]RAT35327.1 dGTPase [Lonsdalea populi]